MKSGIALWMLITFSIANLQSHARQAALTETNSAGHSIAPSFTLEVVFGSNHVKFQIDDISQKELLVQRIAESGSRKYQISKESTTLINAYIRELKNSTSHKISFCPIKYIRITSPKIKHSPLLLCFENNSLKSHNASVLANYLEGYSK